MDLCGLYGKLIMLAFVFGVPIENKLDARTFTKDNWISRLREDSIFGAFVRSTLYGTSCAIQMEVDTFMAHSLAFTNGQKGFESATTVK